MGYPHFEKEEMGMGREQVWKDLAIFIACGFQTKAEPPFSPSSFTFLWGYSQIPNPIGPLLLQESMESALRGDHHVGLLQD